MRDVMSKEPETAKPGLICVLCGETIRSYILAKKDGRYQYPNPQFEKIEHKEIKDCLVFLQTTIKDLESEVRHLDSKID